MNEFLSQFLVESRELVEQATEGLLVLERSPADPERIDAVFRAFHTLKGGAGIVGFPAMERAVHAAENLLSDVRASRRVLSPAGVGDCLACLDQVVQWLDVLETSGQLPAGGEAQAERVAARFQPPVAEVGPGVPDAEETPQWAKSLLATSRAARDAAHFAIRYSPGPECFFEGEDPLARCLSLPDLLALDVAPGEARPDLEALDPYRCSLVFSALVASPRHELERHLSGHSGTVDVHALGRPLPEPGALPARAREILRAQLDLIAGVEPPAFAGVVGSAGATAASVLRACGDAARAVDVAAATARSLEQGTAEPLREALADAPAGRAVPESPHEPSWGQAPAVGTLRVDAHRIDALVRLTGELTVAKNSVGHVLGRAQARDAELARALKDSYAVLDRLVGELQRSVLEVRVLPLRTVLQRFPRVLRELCTTLGKPAELVVEGEDTEADKAIVERLFEPLLHVVRNALDHGVEAPSVRAALGKPATARIVIRARRQSGQIVVEVGDDGGGVDVERLRAEAQRKGLLEAEAARTASDAELLELVFAPGVSTAASVSEVSGRGVGMDAVRFAVEKMGGRVTLESHAGRGTTVRFSLPFSMMLTQVMTVEADGQLYGIPLDAVVGTVRVPAGRVARIGGARAVVLQDRTVPVVDLAEVLGTVRSRNEEAPDVTLVIASAGGHQSALQVDRVGDRLQVMLEPLGGLLSATPGLSGTTLLGDGRVLLVLDVAELLA